MTAAVVTGVGFACPLGVGADEVFDRFVAGADGFRGDHVGEHPVARADIGDPAAVMGSKRDARRSDRMTHLAVAAGTRPRHTQASTGNSSIATVPA